MKVELIYILCISCLLSSCSLFSKEKKLQDSSDEVLLHQTQSGIDTIPLQWEHLEGNWVLTDFIDNVLKYKTITKYRVSPLAAEAWAFKIERDSLFTTGLINDFRTRCNVEPSGNHDIPATIIDEIGGSTFILYYNGKMDKIEAINATDYQEKYIYRRATGELDEILSHTPFQWDREKRRYHVQDSLYNYLINHLVVGSYDPISNYNGIQTMTLTKNGMVKGFKQFDTYRIHAYFGTRHPFDDKDAIFFENSKFKDGYEIYSWKFSNGMLKLTQMYTPDGGDFYYNGKTSYEFIVENGQENKLVKKKEVF